MSPPSVGGAALLGRTDAGFRSAPARLRYLDLYEELRALGPPPDAMHDVATRFGAVRVYQHGPAGGVPIVLLHGYFLTSAMWAHQVAGLTGDFTVYAIDMPGQPGASMQSKSMRNPGDCARCIDEVLGGLGLQDVHLVGHSYGGWLAAHTAARFPQRLVAMTLIDPASTVARISAKFWTSLLIATSWPRSARAQRAAAWVMGDPEPGSFVDQLAGLFLAGFTAFAPPPGHANSALRERSGPTFGEYSLASALGRQHGSQFVKRAPADTRGGARLGVSAVARHLTCSTDRAS